MYAIYSNSNNFISVGTYMMSPKQVCIAMDHALGCGYRLFGSHRT